MLERRLTTRQMKTRRGMMMVPGLHMLDLQIVTTEDSRKSHMSAADEAVKIQHDQLLGRCAAGRQQDD
jgi:hypothetical protein